MLDLIVTIIVGIFLIYAAFKTSERVCPPQKIIYKFIPRTLKEEMENPVKVTEVFDKMFSNPNIFIGDNAGYKVLPLNKPNA
jgi:hypothetical protein